LQLYDSLPKFGSAQIVGRQLARSGTSPGAQYREAIEPNPTQTSLAKSKVHFKNWTKVHIG